MHVRTLLSALVAAFALGACAAPGTTIRPLPGDFAFLEIGLRG